MFVHTQREMERKEADSYTVKRSEDLKEKNLGDLGEEHRVILYNILAIFL